MDGLVVPVMRGLVALGNRIAWRLRLPFRDDLPTLLIGLAAALAGLGAALWLAARLLAG